jgi:hypothetical protein
MMQHMLNAVRVGLMRKSLVLGTAVAGFAGIPSAAFAHHHGFHIDIAVPVRVPVEVAPAPCDTGRVWVEPIYQTVADRQWVEPVYQTVTERVWVPAATTSNIEHVYVPDQYAWRDVVSCDWWGHRRVYRQQVLVCAAHYEDRQVGCVEVPAHYQDVQHQQLICDGHWQAVQRQVIVTPGHWEVAAVAAPVYVEPQATARLEFRLPF